MVDRSKKEAASSAAFLILPRWGRHNNRSENRRATWQANPREHYS